MYATQLLTGVVFFAALLASFALWSFAQRHAEQELQTEFDFQAQEIITQIEQRMTAYQQVLHGVRALFDGSEEVTHQEFYTYVASLRLDVLYPGIQALGHNLLVPHALKAQHIDAIRKQGFPDYTITPTGERELYTPVIYIEPFAARNVKALGYDTFSESMRRAAMVQARDNDRAAVTGKVTLVQETGKQVQAGLLMFLPLYKSDMPPDSVIARRASIYGWVTAVFRLGDLMAGLGHEHAAGLDLEIYDGEAISDQTRMYDAKAVLSRSDSGPPLLKTTRRIEIADHVWTVVIQSSPVFKARFSNNIPFIVAIAGIAFSLLLTMLVRALVRSKNISSELAESEERWRYALEGAGDGVWDWNVQTDEVKYSRRWKEMLGYTEHEIVNRFSECEERIHPDDVADVMADIQAHLDGDTPAYSNEHRTQHKDGSWRWMLDRGLVTSRTQGGKPLRMIGTHTDITERKKSEAKIQRLSSLYSSLSHCDQAIVHSASQDELFPQICRDAVLHGGFKMAWIGLVDKASQRVHPVASYGECTEYLEHIRISVNADKPSGNGPTGTAIRENLPVWCQDCQNDPRTRPWHEHCKQYGMNASAALPLRANGAVIGAFNLYAGEVNAFDEDARELLVQMASDISFALDNFSREQRRKQAEEELGRLNASLESIVSVRTDELMQAKELADAASRAKSDFLSNMSHEIRTPLTAIIGFSEALLANEFDPQEREKITATIVRNGKHLQQVISDILDLSKIEAGQLEIELSETSPFMIMAEIDSLLGMSARDKGLKFMVNYQFPLPKQISTEPTYLKQILINLCSNAIKFTNEGYVQIDVSCHDACRNIRFDVTDSGIGMTPDEVEHVFYPFTQADSTTTRKYGGTGLGLSISSKLAAAIGGTLTCVSQQGKGSCFTLTVAGNTDELVVVNGMAEVGANENVLFEQERIKPLAGTILLVEDNPDNQQLIAMCARKTGAHIVIAGNGREGVDMALAYDYDLILMDMQMPVLDGVQAIKILRNGGYTRPVVSLTANATLSTREKCIAAGADDYLVKPINLTLFYDVLNRYLPASGETSVTRPDEVDALERNHMQDFYSSPGYLAIVERFKQDLPTMVGELSAAVHKESWDQVQSKTHNLKGLGGTMGFDQITEVAGRMNTQVINKDYDQVARTSGELEELCQSILR